MRTEKLGMTRFPPKNCMDVLTVIGSKNGTPTKRQVSKRQGLKRPVSKRHVSKRQVYKTSGLLNVRFQNVQFLNLIYLLNKKYRNCQVCKECVFLLITSHYGDIWQKTL
jgi:hypothetical protein